MRARKTGVSSINASHSVLYMVKVLLAIFVGLLRAAPPVDPGDAPGATAGSARSDAETRLHPTQLVRDHLAAALLLIAISSSCGASG